MKERGVSNKRSIEMMRSLPTQEELDQNLRRLNELLGIDETDYCNIDSEEIQKRIRDRIDHQNDIIYPQRVAEGRVTPEWRRYGTRNNCSTESPNKHVNVPALI